MSYYKAWSRQGQQNAKEAWVIDFFLKLYRSNSFDQIDPEIYISRLENRDNVKLCRAMLRQCEEPEVLARLNALLLRKKR